MTPGRAGADGEPPGPPLDCLRDAFSLPADLHYLNCAYMSPLPRPAEAAGIRGLRRKRVPTGLRSRDFFEEADEVRRRFARLVGADEPRRVAILPAASYGIAVAVRNTPLEEGDNVVVTHEQFPGNVYGWRRAAGEAGAELRVVRPPAGAERGRGWSTRILEAIDAETRAVALGHVHWTDGTRFDLRAIGERAREVDAALVVDGTQSVGALSFDVQELRPDALVCATYKWLLGPYSVALGYFGPRYDDGTPLEETWIARRGSEDFAGLVDYEDAYQPGAVRYDVGERSNFALLPVVLASLELLEAWRPARIQAYCEAVTAELLEEAVSLGFDVESTAWRAAHVFGLRMPAGLRVETVRGCLDERNVAVSLRGSSLRISPHVYNDDADLGMLAASLREAVGSGS